MDEQKKVTANILYKQVEKKHRRNNIIVGIFLCIYIGGYLFFFLSNLIFQNGINEEYYSVPGSSYSLNNREVKILEWRWSEKSGKMEVIIETIMKEFDGMNSYEVSAVSLSGKEVSIKKVLEEPTLLVVQIEGVEKGFNAVSLRISPKGSSSVLKLYTNEEGVEKVEEVEAHASSYYHNIKIEEAINEYNSEIQKLKKRIDELDRDIIDAEEFIGDLEEQTKYQIDAELAESQEIISDTQTKINEMKEEQKKCQESIEENYKKIQKAQEKLQNG